MDMLAVVRSQYGNLLLQRESYEAIEGYEDFSDIEDMLATDWLVDTGGNA